MDRIYESAVKARLRGVVEVDDFYVTAGLKGRSSCGRLGRHPRRRGLKPPLGRGSYGKDEPIIPPLILYILPRKYLEPKNR